MGFDCECHFLSFCEAPWYSHAAAAVVVVRLLLFACSLNYWVSGCYRGYSLYREHYNGGLGGISGVEIGCVYAKEMCLLFGDHC